MTEPKPPELELLRPSDSAHSRRALVLAAGVLGVLLIGGGWFASRSDPPATTLWSGRFLELVDPKYEHSVSLTAAGSKFEGTYFYKEKRLVLDLRGSIKGRKFELDETMSGKKTATFRGEISGDWSHARGTWTHVDGRVLNFEWTRVNP